MKTENIKKQTVKVNTNAGQERINRLSAKHFFLDYNDRLTDIRISSCLVLIPPKRTPIRILVRTKMEIYHSLWNRNKR